MQVYPNVTNRDIYRDKLLIFAVLFSNSLKSTEPLKKLLKDQVGDDLIEEVAVPVEDAVLGGEVHVQTIAGKRIAMKVPPLTQSGKSIKLKGLGMPSMDGKTKGDLVAKVRLVIPEEISDEERELFEQLREARNGHSESRRKKEEGRV